MAEYTNAEKADMILAYGATDCNGRAAHGLYAERHPVRADSCSYHVCSPTRSNYVRPVHSRRQHAIRDLTARTELNEEIALDVVETTPSLTTRGIANEIGISYSSVWRILDDSAPCIHFTTSASSH
ncbi:hypothetical protein TNCV_4644401 [Trichonephila clavipes]|nr:hypothetical protein TNCV_4644401 [Trichonephila clavipes]